MKIPLFINSAENKRGLQHDADFIVHFKPPILLDESKTNRIALLSNSMSWSWYNIAQYLNNHMFRYSHNGGTNWFTIMIPDGQYVYNALDAFIKTALLANGHSNVGIGIAFVQERYKVRVTLATNYQLDSE